MRYSFLLCLFGQSLVLVLFLRTVQSNGNSIDASNDFKKFNERLKLYRKKETSFYFYAKARTLGSISLNRQLIKEPNQQKGRLSEMRCSKLKTKSRAKKPNNRSRDKAKEEPSVRAPEIWNWKSTGFGINEPKPWAKADEKSKRQNARAEEPIAVTRARKPSVKIGNKSVEIGANNLSMPGCGVSITMAIVNGKQATEGAYPWISLLLKNGYAFCAGSIINNEWVLTASHCFMSDRNPDILTVRVGTNNREEGTDYEVSKIIMHERFNFDNMLNSDIALLKVKEKIKMNRLVKPVCLPSHTFQEPQSDSLTVVGWGAQKFSDRNLPIYLQEVKLKLSASDYCQSQYSKKRYTIYRSQICTWGEDQDACQGDSGGPAIEYLDGKATLVGIVSYGATCADEYPGVFTKVSYFINWISTQVKNN